MPSSDPPTVAQPSAPVNLQPSATPTETPKLSGAELKKQAKAEKAARRAQALADKQGGTAVPAPAPPGQMQKTDGAKGAKGQQKRPALTAVDSRNMPMRGGPPQSAPVAQPPPKEDKTVEFFRHLYKPRRTTIAGAGKEVHPAVQALGLQMSSYTICGSCARLVATLQAFKRVSFCICLLGGPSYSFSKLSFASC